MAFTAPWGFHTEVIADEVAAAFEPVTASPRAVLIVDGQEILNFGRQSIPTYTPGHRLNSGAWGTMGVGLPFGLGAKVAKPDKQVLVLHGDGSYGINGMEIDTAVRHRVPVLVVISNNRMRFDALTHDVNIFTRYETWSNERVFFELSRAERLQNGISDSLVRLSCGIEDAEDLMSDLRRALSEI